MSTVKCFTSLVVLSAFLGSVFAVPTLPKIEGKRPELQQFPSPGKNEKELEILDRLANKIQELQHIRMSEFLTRPSPSKNLGTSSQDALHHRNGRSSKTPLRLVVARVRKIGSKSGDGTQAMEEVLSKSAPDEEEGSYSLRKFELRTTLGDLAILNSLSAKIQDLKDMRNMESLRQELEGITRPKDKIKDSKPESKLAESPTSREESQSKMPKAPPSLVQVSAPHEGRIDKRSENEQIKSLESAARNLKEETKSKDGVSQPTSGPKEVPQEADVVAVKVCDNCTHCIYPST
jgi:hypothetical protein